MMSRLPVEFVLKISYRICFELLPFANLNFENLNQDISKSIIARCLKLCQLIENDDSITW